ncbi:hypothetical protein INT47_006748 [Mucor saturninus]|uniref:Uncharacterized protein n=1 Tax=Mucor saturninus TaxID=64648 RepID=A0A8H7UZ78_9FUNG|nr:hypothetical protein INT47_006748 [Mucor saturninus]
MASDDLTPVERKRMCAGLSGVIDISDYSHQGHRSLFIISQWKIIKECNARFKRSFFQPRLDSDLHSVYIVWDIIHKTLAQDHNIFHARKTFNHLSSENHTNEYTFKQLQIIDHILDSFDNKQYILNPAKTTKFTERDYESTIWSGESVEETTKKKAQQYGSDKNIIGFKVDIRLIHDHEDLEIDLVSIDISLPFPDDAKVCHDESKLLRESAISTETIHHLLNDDYVYTWTIRVSGLTAILSKVLYDDERQIYVNIYQFTLIFPTCISDLEDWKDSLESLFKFKEDVERIANKVQKELKHTQRCIYRSEDISPERKLAPTPSVYFTPPRNEAHRSV